ncbi:polysaccharide pyruvyl transferase CsaB [Halocella sp. SP3-1]|uniref:polysaccharide pyruvyl transferase CsaB n=1 Tax=Halocella sp. SP3-1 TaxID=2382161 RepID=UPI000F75C556|nr:polysaccharide pyruvyl transferase CsaB [Halocella sp. SP3-1]AZO94085.1 polysaccharide pyruvyl transferase CsaB [Halocella sp. SP3-1]
MVKIVISGYYGFDNMGDEAVLNAMLISFRELADQLKIVVLSGAPQKTAARYGVKAVKRNNYREVFKEIKSCDLFISGGGSLLQDVTGWKSIPFYLGQLMLASLLGKKTMLFGQGIGPIKSKLYRQLAALIIKKVDLVTVRDEESRDFLIGLGLKGKDIAVTADPVFYLSPGDNKQIQGRELLAEEGIKADSKLIGISVRPWAGEGYLKEIAKAVKELSAVNDGEVLIIPMHPAYDLTVSEKLLELLDGQVNILSGDYTPLEMIAIFGELDFLLGVRLHSLIFSLIQGIPFVAISYDPKVDSLLKSLRITAGMDINKLNGDTLKRVCQTVLSNTEQFNLVIEGQLVQLRKKALLNTEFALGLLGDDSIDRL